MRVWGAFHAELPALAADLLLLSSRAQERAFGELAPGVSCSFLSVLAAEVYPFGNGAQPLGSLVQVLVRELVGVEEAEEVQRHMLVVQAGHRSL